MSFGAFFTNRLSIDLKRYRLLHDGMTYIPNRSNIQLYNMNDLALPILLLRAPHYDFAQHPIPTIQAPPEFQW